MYLLFLNIHSLLNWLVLISLLSTLFMSIQGLISKRNYLTVDKTFRIISTSLIHLQFIVGLVLYFGFSPLAASFLANGAGGNRQLLFFGIYHFAMMVVAVVAITIGGAFAKRATTNQLQFRTICISFSITLIFILLAIPWFRPYFRFLSI